MIVAKQGNGKAVSRDGFDDGKDRQGGGTMTLAVHDRLAIHELLALHGHLLDDGDLSRLDELFTEDIVYDLEDLGMGTHHGLDQFRVLTTNAMKAVDRNPIGHHVTNVLVTDDDDVGTIRVRSKGIGIAAAGKAGSVVYEDVVAKTPAGWRIARRKILLRRAPPASA